MKSFFGRYILLLGFVVALWTFCPGVSGSSKFEPHAGDMLFQSLGKNLLTDLIQGSSESPFSHCGMVVGKAGAWQVIEAIGPVRQISLEEWIAQGTGGGFAAFRLSDEYQVRIPQIVAEARKFLGRPYDSRFRFDDEHIYCSELLFKAFRSATGEPLGRVRQVRELKWEPYRATIEALEGGPVPLERELITPRDLSEAPQLRAIFRVGI